MPNTQRTKNIIRTVGKFRDRRRYADGYLLQQVIVGGFTPVLQIKLNRV